jgi:hypothetical protein
MNQSAAQIVCIAAESISFAVFYFGFVVLETIVEVVCYQFIQ